MSCCRNHSEHYRWIVLVVVILSVLTACVGRLRESDIVYSCAGETIVDDKKPNNYTCRPETEKPAVNQNK